MFILNILQKSRKRINQNKMISCGVNLFITQRRLVATVKEKRPDFLWQHNKLCPRSCLFGNALKVFIENGPTSFKGQADQNWVSKGVGPREIRKFWKERWEEIYFMLIRQLIDFVVNNAFSTYWYSSSCYLFLYCRFIVSHQKNTNLLLKGPWLAQVHKWYW